MREESADIPDRRGLPDSTKGSEGEDELTASPEQASQLSNIRFPVLTPEERAERDRLMADYLEKFKEAIAQDPASQLP